LKWTIADATRECKILQYRLESEYEEFKRTQPDESEIPDAWRTKLSKTEQNLLRCLWDRKPKTLATIDATAWVSKEIEDQTIVKTCTRANKKIFADGFTIVQRNGHIQLEKLTPDK